MTDIQRRGKKLKPEATSSDVVRVQTAMSGQGPNSLVVYTTQYELDDLLGEFDRPSPPLLGLYTGLLIYMLGFLIIPRTVRPGAYQRIADQSRGDDSSRLRFVGRCEPLVAELACMRRQVTAQHRASGKKEGRGALRVTGATPPDHILRSRWLIAFGQTCRRAHTVMMTTIAAVFGARAARNYPLPIRVFSTRSRAENICNGASWFGIMLRDLQGEVQWQGDYALLFQHPASWETNFELLSGTVRFRPIDVLDQPKHAHTRCMDAISHSIGVRDTFADHVVRKCRGVKTVYWFLIRIGPHLGGRRARQTQIDQTFSHLWADSQPQ